MHGTDDILKGKWEQLRGQLKYWWGELSDDELDKVNGSREKLIGQLREKYGWTQERAESEVDRFIEGVRVPQ